MDDQFYADLISDTDFTIATVGSLMHSRPKVRTPLAVLNCIYGGGVPLSIMSEVSGVTGSGKSTFLYQCMANYQKDFPNGVSIIIDMETSMDTNRLESLGVDTNKVLRLPATTLERAFANMYKALNKLVKAQEQYEDISAFIVYDSLSAGGTEKEQDAVNKGEDAFGKGSIQEDVRIIKKDLKLLLPYYERMPIFLGLINQVFVHPNMRNPNIPAKVESGGGNALKHLCHNHIVFGKAQEDYDGIFLVGSESKMELHKSKLSPKMINIPCYIDSTKGGKIDEVESFIRYLTDASVGFIIVGPWYVFGSYLKETIIVKYPVLAKHENLTTLLGKKLRKSDMYNKISEDLDLFYFLQIALIEVLDDRYPEQRKINDAYQKELMSNCKYFEEV